jgi:hypothetical protein
VCGLRADLGFPSALVISQRSGTAVERVGGHPKQLARSVMSVLPGRRGHTGKELGTTRESVQARRPTREKRFDAKLQRQAQQRGYKIVRIEEKPAA